MARHDWRHRAACRNLDPEIFFPVAEAGPVLDAAEARAKAVCARCPVRAQCLAFALDALPYGIAGGLTADERRALRERRARAVPEPDPPETAPRRRPDPSPLAGRSARGERVRARGIELLLKGRTPTDVAGEMGVDERTAQRWAARPEVRPHLPARSTRDPLSRRSLARVGS